MVVMVDVYLSTRELKVATTDLVIQTIPPRWDNTEDHVAYWIGYWTFIGETLVESPLFNSNWQNKMVVKFGEFIVLCRNLMQLILAGSRLIFRPS